MLPAYGLIVIGIGWYSLFYFEHDRTLGWDKVGVWRSAPRLVRRALRSDPGPVLVGAVAQEVWAAAIALVGLALELGVIERPGGDALARSVLVYGGLGAAGITILLAALGWLRGTSTEERRNDH